MELLILVSLFTDDDDHDDHDDDIMNMMIMMMIIMIIIIMDYSWLGQYWQTRSIFTIIKVPLSN